MERALNWKMPPAGERLAGRVPVCGAPEFEIEKAKVGIGGDIVLPAKLQCVRVVFGSSSIVETTSPTDVRRRLQSIH